MSNYHLTPTQRVILDDLVRAHPGAYRSRVAAEFRLHTGRRITLKTVTDTRVRLGLAAPAVYALPGTAASLPRCRCALPPGGPPC